MRLLAPTYADAPQSYTPESSRRCSGRAPAASSLLRRWSCGCALSERWGHPTDKIELIVMGGTFLAQPVDYQYRFIKECYDGLNGTASGSRKKRRKINETRG